MAETVGSPQAAGKSGHFQALVFRGEARAGDRRSVHLSASDNIYQFWIESNHMAACSRDRDSVRFAARREVHHRLDGTTKKEEEELPEISTKEFAPIRPRGKHQARSGLKSAATGFESVVSSITRNRARRRVSRGENAGADLQPALHLRRGGLARRT